MGPLRQNSLTTFILRSYTRSQWLLQITTHELPTLRELEVTSGVPAWTSRLLLNGLPEGIRKVTLKVDFLEVDGTIV